MTARRRPVVQPTERTWRILHRCYPGQDPATVLERGLLLLAGADGNLLPGGEIKSGVGGRPATRRPS